MKQILAYLSRWASGIMIDIVHVWMTGATNYNLENTLGVESISHLHAYAINTPINDRLTQLLN